MSKTTSQWKFCPVCGESLTSKTIEGKDKLACKQGHFTFFDNPVPVVAALILAEGGVVLVKRGAWPFIGQWCLPRGFIDTDERPKQAIAREVREEAGLYVWLKRILCMYNPSLANLPLNQVTTVFLATVRGGKLEAGSDSLEARIFPLDQLPDLCFDTDKAILREWMAGSHGTVEVSKNFPKRSTIILPEESS